MTNTIQICDAPMGTGKTTAAINYINNHPEKKFLFITPYLEQVDRIVNACEEREFIAPINNGDGKLSNLETLLESHSCIASTHALFSLFTKRTAEIIARNEYTLILDETLTVIDLIKLKRQDDYMLLESKSAFYNGKTRVVNFSEGEYSGDNDAIATLYDASKRGEITYYGESCYVWTFSPDMFRCFNEVIVMSYLFDKQLQYYYHKVYGFKMTNLYVGRDVAGQLCFTSKPVKYEHLKVDVEKIMLYHSEKINKIGNQTTALSKSWFESGDPERLKTIKNNTYNFFQHICKVKSKDVIWTSFKSVESRVAPNGYARSFVACNSRATNAFADRHCLAYCANIYANPVFVNYFKAHDIIIDKDGYALTMLLQWIWRSAIRNGEEIRLYIPSRRMRHIFEDWVNAVREGKNI